MLLSAVILLDPLDDAARRTTASQVQRWLKDRFEEANKELFDELHQPNIPRAYTISAVVFPREHSPWLRITSLDPRLSALLCDLLPNLKEIVLDPRNDRAKYAVRGVELGSQVRPPFGPGRPDLFSPLTWAGRTTYSRLINAVMRPPEIDDFSVRLHFRTCTAFRNKMPEGDPGKFDSALPLPVPRFVFQNQLRQWEELSTARLPIPIKPFLEHYVKVAYHRIRFERFSFARWGNRGQVRGFTGYVVFELARQHQLPRAMQRDWRHYVDVVRLLAAFSFYAGTGVSTARGLGQTLPVERVVSEG